MKFNMSLNEHPFDFIKHGKKTIETRLDDEKRSQLKEKDLIEFTNIKTLESIIVEVVELYKYNNFDELYKHFDKISLGYDADEIADPKDMEKYYSKKEQETCGVIGIKIKAVGDRK